MPDPRGGALGASRVLLVLAAAALAAFLSFDWARAGEAGWTSYGDDEAAISEWLQAGERAASQSGWSLLGPFAIPFAALVAGLVLVAVTPFHRTGGSAQRAGLVALAVLAVVCLVLTLVVGHSPGDVRISEDEANGLGTEVGRTRTAWVDDVALLLVATVVALAVHAVATRRPLPPGAPPRPDGRGSPDRQATGRSAGARWDAMSPTTSPMTPTTMRMMPMVLRLTPATVAVTAHRRIAPMAMRKIEMPMPMVCSFVALVLRSSPGEQVR